MVLALPPILVNTDVGLRRGADRHARGGARDGDDGAADRGARALAPRAPGRRRGSSHGRRRGDRVRDARGVHRRRRPRRLHCRRPADGQPAGARPGRRLGRRARPRAAEAALVYAQTKPARRPKRTDGPVTTPRARALRFLAAGLTLAARAAAATTAKVGSKNFTEALLLGELYAQILESRDAVTRKLNSA